MACRLIKSALNYYPCNRFLIYFDSIGIRTRRGCKRTSGKGSDGGQGGGKGARRVLTLSSDVRVACNAGATSRNYSRQE